MEIGIKQPLYVVKKTNLGVFLSDEPDKVANSILLKSEEYAASLNLGDTLEVFVYLNHDEEMTVTLKVPPIERGQIGYLRVKELTTIGAFLDLGLDKDILLPFREQKGELSVNQEIMVGIYLDKSDRLCATMDLSKVLSCESPYKEDDIINGMVYQAHEELGAFIAVEQRYQGLIQAHDLVAPLRRGDLVQCRVVKVRPDGKLNLTLKDKAYIQVDKDAKMIIGKLSLKNGFLPYHDKSSTDEIKREFNMSKKSFKKAVGKLYKDKMITIEEKGIRLNIPNMLDDEDDDE